LEGCIANNASDKGANTKDSGRSRSAAAGAWARTAAAPPRSPARLCAALIFIIEACRAAAPCRLSGSHSNSAAAA